MLVRDHTVDSAHCAERARPSNTEEATTSAPLTHSDPTDSASPLLRLPRELRDQIYDHVFSLVDTRGDRALRIERRHLRYFTPTAANILLILHHEDLLLNSQVASEALEVLLKKHTVYLSCGPFVLKTLLSRIEEQGNLGKRWLKWMSKIELDWITFPNLRMYPPERANGKDEWWWENDGQEIDVDYIRGAQYNGHYDEYDYEGSGYDDNLYEPSDSQLYPALPRPNQSFSQPPDPADPFGFSTHYPFSDPSRAPGSDDDGEGGQTMGADDIATKLELLVEMEVTPLFEYLASPTFALSSITLPLYFISKQTYHQRNTSRPGYGLPLKLRYWVAVVVHALNLLLSPSRTLAQPPLSEVRVKYLPWDIWASMDPSDDLNYIVEEGVWFDSKDANDRPEGEGEAFKAVWDALSIGGVEARKDLAANVKLVKWDGELDKWRVGDELDVVFTRR